MGVINQKLSVIKEASIFLFQFPTVQGFGNTSGFEFILQDRTGGPLDKLAGTAYGFIGELMQRKEIAYAFTTFNTGNPQYMLNVDEAKAKQLGVSVSDLLQTLQVYYGSSFASDFNRFGKYYRVIVQADVAYRADPSSLNNVFVKNNRGEMVPVNTIVSLERVYGPETVTRNNLFNAVTINGLSKPGYSSGDAIKAIQEVAQKYLPRGFSYEWSGMTKEEIGAGSQTKSDLFTKYNICLLSAGGAIRKLYSSVCRYSYQCLQVSWVYLHSSILMGIENNIYVQVGLIMLVGLLAKNAILIVEYAVQRRRAGMALVESALEASQLRLRPILMTSFAFIVGLLAAYLGKRWVGIGQSLDRYRCIGWNAYRCNTWRIYHPCTVRHFPVFAGKN